MCEVDIDYMFKFAGYGDPKSRVWFIGIEEGGGMKAPARDTHQRISPSGLYYDPNLPELSNPNGSSVWKICSEIAAECRIGKNYFRSNMGAIPRRSERDVIEGFNQRNYVSRVVAERIPMLRDLSERFKPAVLVFHGKAAWTRYQVRDQFGLKTPDSGSSARVIAYLRQRVLLTNFFSRRYGCFTTDDQNAVEGYIMGLLRLPISSKP